MGRTQTLRPASGEDRAMPAGMIHAEQLIYEYDKRDDEGNVIGFERAIDGIDIDIPQGSFVAILGHNGSGKSTLAKHMNAILVPTGGTMWVDGRDTKDPAQLWDVRQTAGMVFQNPDNQIIGTVVEEDVGFGPENLGVPTDEIWKRVEESLKAVGMLERRKDSPNKLSGWPLPACWPWSPNASCWMSPPPCWIRTEGKK